MAKIDDKIKAKCEQALQEQELQEQEQPGIGNDKIEAKSDAKIEAECKQG